MNDVLEKFLENIKFDIADSIISEPGRSFMNLPSAMFDVLVEAVNANAYYSNSRTKFTLNSLELTLREYVNGNWCQVKIEALKGTDLVISASLLGYDTITEGGGYILTDSLKSKKILGW